MCPWKVHIFVSVQATKGQTVLTTRNEYVLCPLCADYRIVGWRARQSSELNPLALHQTHRCILYISTNLRCTYVVARDRVSRGPPHMPLLTWWRSCSLRRTLDLCTLCDCCLVAELLLCSVSVCQCFAVLEDGALAHNLQEQESEYCLCLTLRTSSWKMTFSVPESTNNPDCLIIVLIYDKN